MAKLNKKTPCNRFGALSSAKKQSEQKSCNLTGLRLPKCFLSEHNLTAEGLDLSWNEVISIKAAEPIQKPKY